MNQRDILDAATICGYYIVPEVDPNAEGYYCVRCASWVRFGGDLPTCGGAGLAVVVYGSYDARSNDCRRCQLPLHERPSLATFRDEG